MDKNFIGDRITDLRVKKNLTEKELSRALGRSPSYVQALTSHNSLPSFQTFFEICDFFQITPSEFFDPSLKDPAFHHQIMAYIQEMSEEDLNFCCELFKRMYSKQS